MTLTPDDAHALAIGGAVILEFANDDDLWRDFLALVERSRVLAEANAVTRDAADAPYGPYSPPRWARG